MPRSGRRLRRATFYYLKQIARAKHPMLRRGRAQWRICFCGAHEIILSFAQNRGFCAIGAATTERGCKPRFTRLAQSGVCRRDVILSRRACGVSKNLLWLPRSNCYAIMPAFYTQTLLHSCKILRLRASLSARHFAQDDMRAAGCPRGLIPRERCPLCHVPRAASCRCRIPRTGVIALHGLLRGQRECP